jgi:hypothetical protein
MVTTIVTIVTALAAVCALGLIAVYSIGFKLLKRYGISGKLNREKVREALSLMEKEMIQAKVEVKQQNIDSLKSLVETQRKLIASYKKMNLKLMDIYKGLNIAEMDNGDVKIDDVFIGKKKEE